MVETKQTVVALHGPQKISIVTQRHLRSLMAHSVIIRPAESGKQAHRQTHKTATN